MHALHLQNAALFTISIISLYSCLTYDYAEFGKLNINNIILVVFSVVDSYYNKKIELKLHHCFTVCIISYNFIYNVDVNDSGMIIYYFTKTELSSIFMILKYYFDKKTQPLLYYMNDFLFVATFLKFRVIDLWYGIIQSESPLYFVVNKYTPNDLFGSSLLLVGSYGLYILNLYWFTIILKILYKQFCFSNYINDIKLSAFICRYTMFINLAILMYTYSYYENEQTIFDWIGTAFLSINSYEYHTDNYKKLSNENIYVIIFDYENLVYFFNDNISIQLRAFLLLFTNYYNSKYLYPVIAVSLFIHCISIYKIICNMLWITTIGVVKSTTETDVSIIESNEKKCEDYFTMQKMITIASVTYDICFIFFISRAMYSIPFFIVTVLIGIAFIVKPFYKLNHVAFHLLLLIHTYYACMSNVN